MIYAVDVKLRFAKLLPRKLKNHYVERCVIPELLACGHRIVAVGGPFNKDVCLYLVAARAMYERKLKIQKSALGAEHPDTLATMNNLMIVRMQQGMIVRMQQGMMARGKATLTADRDGDGKISEDELRSCLLEQGRNHLLERLVTVAKDWKP